MSYRPMFEFKSGEVCGNSQRFATRGEADQSASARFVVWTTPTGYHVEQSDDPVNYRRVDNMDQHIT